MVNIENELFEDIVATPLQLNQALPLGLAGSFHARSASVSAYIILPVVLSQFLKCLQSSQTIIVETLQAHSLLHFFGC